MDDQVKGCLAAMVVLILTLLLLSYAGWDLFAHIDGDLW